MTNDVTGLGELIYDMQAGQCAATAALIIALDEKGILPISAYCGVLRRLWTAMPEDAAAGEAGAAIERLLDQLDSHARRQPPGDDATKKREVAARDGKCAKAGASGWAVRRSLKVANDCFRSGTVETNSR